MFSHRFIGNSRWLMAAAIIFGLASQAHAVCYVNANAAGHNNGSSWTDAWTNLQFALIDPTCSEIWVARGVYTPTVFVPDPKISFEVPSGTALYGGFRGNETDRNARDPKTNLTILSGDIDHNDDVATDSIDWSAANIVGTNTYLVVHIDPGFAATTLDGFVVTGGDEQNDPSHTYNSGGIACWSGSFDTCRILLLHDVIAGNTQGGFSRDAFGASTTGGGTETVVSDGAFVGNSGGAIFLLDSGINQTTITRVEFTDNHASGFSSAIALNESGLATTFPTATFLNINQSTFSANSGDFGGAINLQCIGADAQVNIENSTFANNNADVGGAIFSAMHDASYDCSGDMAINNSTFSHNSSGSGGAIYYAYDALPSVGPSIKNTILWNDDACSFCGPEIAAKTSGPTISDSVVDGGCPSGSSCTNVTLSDPLLSELGYFGGSVPTILVGWGGSAVDTGNDSSCALNDERGVVRPQGAHCDIGAVEWSISDDIIFLDGFGT